MKIAIEIDKNAALRGGHDVYGWGVVDIPAAELSDEERETLVAAGKLGVHPKRDTYPTADYYLWGHHHAPDGNRALTPAAEATPAAVRLRLGEIRAADEAGREAVRQRDVEAQAAREQAARSSQQRAEAWSALPLRERANTLDISGLSYYRPDGYPEGLRMEDLHRYAPEALAEAVTERKRIEAERHVEQRQRAEAAEREIADWIAEHGSDRLKRLAAEGLSHLRVYRDERLALERPGWQWLSCVCGDVEDVDGVHVTDAHLAALDAARETEPDAQLAWLGEGDHCRECACPCDEWGGPTVDQRVVLHAQYLDNRDILLEIDEGEAAEA